MSLSKVFITILIGSLIIGSAISIGIFLFGEFGSTESRILGSIAALGFFSLAGLCSSTIYESDKYRRVSIAGVISATMAFILVLTAIWEIIEMDWFAKPTIISIVLAIAIAHVSLLLRIDPENKDVTLIRRWTVVSVIVLAALLIVGLLLELYDYDFFIRLVGVVAILDVLGTVLVPILHYTLDKTSLADGKINYHNRRFRVKATSTNSETDTNTIFHYKQEGEVLSCEYSSAHITKGHLLGTVDEAGTIRMRYHQINTKGDLMTGICTSTPEIQADGKILLHENWEWTSGDRTKGSSQLIEI